MTQRKDQTASLPNSLYGTYLASPLMATVKLVRFKFPAKLISANDDVLDLGCGRGLGAFFYAQVTKGNVLGIDLHTDFSELTEFEKQRNLSFVREDLPNPSDALLKNVSK